MSLTGHGAAKAEVAAIHSSPASARQGREPVRQGKFPDIRMGGIEQSRPLLRKRGASYGDLMLPVAGGCARGWPRAAGG